MEKNEFFREATMAICGNLEIENALFSCLQVLKKIMPVDHIFLQHFDPEYNAMRSIAAANSTGSKKLDLLTPLSEEARVSIKRPQLPLLDKIYIFEDPAKYAISREMLAFHGVPCTSLMVMLLVSNDQTLGNVVVCTEGEEKYSKEHAKFLSLLNEPFLIAFSNTLEHRQVLKLKDLLMDDNRYLQGELRRLSGEEIVGANFGLRDVMEQVRQVAPMDSPVLLLGETGVGKDVIANALHYSSPRKNGPFITVNCGAIPDTLIDSELFGHEKGAFTGAMSQKRGRFERADKGTIFLDEIAELPLLSQTRLLHVLHNRTIERVGGTKTISLDIRIIAATNQNLKDRVKNNQFREDLWFRLNVFPITIPPLRERKTDIPALLQHFLSQKSKQLKLVAIPEISPSTIDILTGYDWPGNVRELENIVERTLILDRDGPLRFDHLKADGGETRQQLSEGPNDIVNLDESIINHIQKILDRTKGKIHGPGGAADLLGINPSTLRNRMKKLGIVNTGKGKK
jgi:transcriptional regulator with GAF, ATPase, and Fis domain